MVFETVANWGVSFGRITYRTVSMQRLATGALGYDWEENLGHWPALWGIQVVSMQTAVTDF
jgi:hypothetical protein